MGNMRFLLSLLTALALLLPATTVTASQATSPQESQSSPRGYAVHVTTEATIEDDDLDAARDEAEADAARQALRSTLEEELGSRVVAAEEERIEQLFLDPYQDFLNSIELVEERRAGDALFAGFAVFPHITRIRTVITNSQLTTGDDGARLTVIWAEESRSSGSDQEAGFAGYHTAAWSSRVTEPAVLPELLDELAANELNVVPPSTEVLEWAAQELGDREIDQAFLRRLGSRMEVGYVVFLRLVRRSAPTPQAARFQVDRLNHVAFLFDVASGELMTDPITASLPELEQAAAAEKHTTMPREWMQQVVTTLADATAQPRTQVTVRGLASVREFDEMWRRLRQSPGLGDVAPSLIRSDSVHLELLGDRPLDEWAALIQRALPEATVEVEREKIRLRLVDEPEPTEPAPETEDAAPLY